MSLPSLRRRLILTLSGAGLLLLVIISLLMVVAEDKMEELSLRHWLEAEVTRYSDDWLRLGMAAPPQPAPVLQLLDRGRPPAGLAQALPAPGLLRTRAGDEDKHFLVRPHPSGEGLLYLVFNDDADDYLILTRINCTWRPG